MSGQANISSIDALETFRADLIRFIAKARTALEDVHGEVRRTQSWMDVDRARHWTAELRRSTQQLHQAEQELYSANLASPKASNAFQNMAVLKARRKVEEAEEKLRRLKKWRQSFETRSTPLLRQLDPASQHISQQLPKGVHSLAESIKALQAYADKPLPVAGPAPITEEGGEP